MFLQLFVICLWFGLNDLLIVDNSPTACRDKIDNCRFYQADMCTADGFKAWALEHCILFCGFCNPAVTSPVNCADKVSCSMYDPDGSLCSNATYRFWIEDNCRSHCHVMGC